ncbi:hypothetical protein PENTCL1PPCAC_8301, partial [Pristionchus entomophagus]
QRILTVVCGDKFHHTCLVNWCELEIGEPSKSVICCPNCDTPLEDEVYEEYGELFFPGTNTVTNATDEYGQKIPLIVGFGITGHPSREMIAFSPNNPNLLSRLDKVFFDTCTWLKQITQQLAYAREFKNEEYLQDIVAERTKLMERLRMTIKLHEDYADLKKRIELATKPTVEDDVASTTAAAAAVPFEMTAAALNTEDPICTICYDSVHTK